MSTNVRTPARSKKFNWRVLPGSELARASPFLPVSAFNSEDFPTFERPAKATSGRSAGGNWSSVCAPWKKRHSAANSRRPASSAAGSSDGRVSEEPAIIASAPSPSRACQRRLDQLGFPLNEPLLGDRERVVPAPVDDEARREF